MGIIRESLYTIDEFYLATTIFRTFAHPLRLRILASLLVHETRTVGELAKEFGGAQSCVSDHIAILKEINLVIGTHVQNSILYKLNRPMWDAYKGVLASLADDEQFKQLHVGNG